MKFSLPKDIEAGRICGDTQNGKAVLLLLRQQKMNDFGGSIPLSPHLLLPDELSNKKGWLINNQLTFFISCIPLLLYIIFQGCINNMIPAFHKILFTKV